jgi:hypothetical protein
VSTTLRFPESRVRAAIAGLHGYPPVVNDARATGLAVEAAREVLGAWRRSSAERTP